MRVIVVGGGVIGMLTAWECGAAGAEATLINQGPIPDPAGSSHDRHRVLRALHPGDPVSCRAAALAHRRWLDWEKRLREPLYHRCGALSIVPADDAAAGLADLRAAGLTAETLSTGDLRRRYPLVDLTLGQGRAVFEQDAGVLFADRILHALAALLARHPRVRLLPERRVIAVEERGGVRLEDGCTVSGDAVICACGPWSRELLPPGAAALTLYRQTMLYCLAPHDLAAAWERMPAMPAMGTAGGTWLVPPVAGTPLKLSAARACRPVDAVNGRRAPRELHDLLVDLFTPLLDGFHPDWVLSARDCYYLADAAAGGAVMVPLGDGVGWAFAGCGGSSFKFAPLIAESLARRALGLQSAEPPWLDHSQVLPPMEVRNP